MIPKYLGMKILENKRHLSSEYRLRQREPNFSDACDQLPGVKKKDWTASVTDLSGM